MANYPTVPQSVGTQKITHSGTQVERSEGGDVRIRSHYSDLQHDFEVVHDASNTEYDDLIEHYAQHIYTTFIFTFDGDDDQYICAYAEAPEEKPITNTGRWKVTNRLIRLQSRDSLFAEAAESLSAENVRDIIGNALRGTAPINVTANDASDTITISLTGGVGENNVQANWNESNSSSDAFIRNKPTLAPSNAEQNVQANWGETSSTSDAYIQNKPTIQRFEQVANQAAAQAKPTDDGIFYYWLEP